MFLVMELNSDLVSECVQQALCLLNLCGSSTLELILKKEQESAETAKYVLQRTVSSTHSLTRLTKSLFNAIARNSHA